MAELYNMRLMFNDMIYSQTYDFVHVFAYVYVINNLGDVFAHKDNTASNNAQSLHLF